MGPSRHENDQSAAVAPLARRLHDQLISDVAAGRSRGSIADRIDAVVNTDAGLLDAAARATLNELIGLRCTGLGPLEPLLADSGIDEIMVSGTEPIHVERRGRIEPADTRFGTEVELRAAIDRILAPIGRRVDESSPLCDARLPDGSRVNVVMPPLAVGGPALTIRRFRHGGYSSDELIELGTWTPELASLLGDAVRSRASVLVSGGTGSGKTTTLSAIASQIDPAERLIVIEDTTELRLRMPHVVRLEARPANVEGAGAVPIRDLVRNALRMRPDRIIVGEVRGGEALDMVTAMTTGHDGSLSTVHASSPQAALRRLETLCLMAGVGLPHGAICSLIADGVDLIVHQERLPGGERVVTAAAEVVEHDGGLIAKSLYAR